jgi:hypothetical protein
MTDFYTFDYDCEDYLFPRLTKRSSTKYTANHKHAATRRNILQKEKQISDKLSRNYREKERNQKRDGIQSRIYHCATCNKKTNAPCRCNYVQWCGKDCEWDYCNESSRLGIRDELAVSYDFLCDYHSSKYYEYLEKC